MPIAGMPSSNQQEAFGASGGIISTGFERKVNRDKIEAELPQKPSAFTNILRDLVNPEESVIEVKKGDEKEELEKVLNQSQMTEKISRHHAHHVRKKVELKKEEKREAQPPPPEENLTPEEKAKRREEALLKDYIALAAKWIVGRPPEDMDAVKVMIGQIRQELIRGGISPEDLKYLDQKTLDMIKEALLHLIKDKFLSSLDRPLELLELILNSTKSQSIVEFLTSFEEDSFLIGRYVTEFDINDITQIAASLGIDLDVWMKELKLEKIKIENFEKLDEITINFRFEEAGEARDISDWITSYRVSLIEVYMSETLMEKISITFHNISMARKLHKSGVSKEELEELKTQARRIAWFKVVLNLKMVHLNRILSTSSAQFEDKSREIEKLTKKTLKLGFDIPKEGMKWMEKSLQTLELESAEYKIELLRSLQKISYEEGKEKDILYLTRVIEKIKTSPKRKIFNFSI